MITTAYTFITATLAAWIEREREFYMQQLKLVAERERERQKATSPSIVEHYFLHPLTSELVVWPNNFKSLAEKQKVR